MKCSCCLNQPWFIVSILLCWATNGLECFFLLLFFTLVGFDSCVPIWQRAHRKYLDGDWTYVTTVWSGIFLKMPSTSHKTAATTVLMLVALAAAKRASPFLYFCFTEYQDRRKAFLTRAWQDGWVRFQKTIHTFTRSNPDRQQYVTLPSSPQSPCSWDVS